MQIFSDVQMLIAGRRTEKRIGLIGDAGRSSSNTCLANNMAVPVVLAAEAAQVPEGAAAANTTNSSREDSRSGLSGSSSSASLTALTIMHPFPILPPSAATLPVSASAAHSHRAFLDVGDDSLFKRYLFKL